VARRESCVCANTVGESLVGWGAIVGVV